MIALLLAIGLALAGPVEDGDQAFEAGDYPSALVSWGDALKAAAPEERLPLLLRMAAAQRELGAVDLAARVLDEALPHAAASSGGPKRNARDLSVPGAT